MRLQGEVTTKEAWGYREEVTTKEAWGYREEVTTKEAWGYREEVSINWVENQAETETFFEEKSEQEQNI